MSKDKDKNKDKTGPEKGSKSSKSAPLKQGMDDTLKLMDKGLARIRSRNMKEDQAKTRDKLSGQEDDFAGEEREALERDDAEKARGAALQARKAARKKMQRRIAYVAVGAGLFVWLAWYLFAPYKAGITYGVCNTFLQLQVAYPQHMRISEVEDFGDSVRIWYVRMDPFGEERMESMRCYFRYVQEDEEVKYGTAPFVIDRVTRNRRPYFPEKVEAFNRSIPAVIAGNPDLVIPDPLPDSLSGLKFDVRSFRAIRLD